MKSLGLLWTLARRQPLIYPLHTFFSALDNHVLFLIPPLALSELLDRLTVGRSDIIGLLAILAAVPLIDTLAFTLTARVDARLLETAGSSLRRNMLDRILHRPGARALPSSPGEALVRFRDDPKVVTHSLDWIADPVVELFATVFRIIVLWKIDALLTISVVAPAVIVVGVVNLAAPRIKDARRRRQESLGNVSGLLGEAFHSVAAIKAADAEVDVTNRLRELNDVRRHATLRDLMLEMTLGMMSRSTASIAIGAILIVAAPSVVGGRLSIGDLTLFLAYAPLGAYGLVGHLLTLLRQTDMSIDRMSELLKSGNPADLVRQKPVHLRGPLPELPRYTRETEPFRSFEACGLTVRHPESGGGITGVDLAIKAGEFVVVTGRVGSGKTTLLRALLGLLPADQGELRWNGRKIADPSNFLVPPRCAYTPQVPQLFSMDLADNVLLGIEGDLDAAAHAAVLEEDLSALELGWQTLVGSRGVKLSGGQIQRAAAARMFVRDAQLLVFDDLSSALDVGTELLLWKRLFERKSPTCLVVSHRRAALVRADRVILLSDGQVQATGRLDELLEKSREMQAIWSSA